MGVIETFTIESHDGQCSKQIQQGGCFVWSGFVAVINIEQYFEVIFEFYSIAGQIFRFCVGVMNVVIHLLIFLYVIGQGQSDQF